MPRVTGVNSKHLREGEAEPVRDASVARIFSMRFCPWAERALLYAAAQEIPVEVININLSKKPEWYLTKHPKGTVPAFEQNGKVVIESGIIPEYLDGIHPERAILPSDPYLRARQRMLVDLLSPLAPAFYGLLALVKEHLEGAAKEEKIKAIEAALDNAEKLLTEEFYGGSKLGYADWLTYPFIERLYIFSHFTDVPIIDKKAFPGKRWPKLSVYYPKISQSAPVKAVTQSVETFELWVQSVYDFKTSHAVDYDVVA